MDPENAKVPGSGSRSLSRYRHSLRSHKPIPVCLPSVSVCLSACLSVGSVMTRKGSTSGEQTVDISVYFFKTKNYHLSHQKLNKLIQITNGNIIKLFHLNKSSSNILSKLTLIQDLIDREKPLVCSLNESNCVMTDPKQVNPIAGYTMEHKLLKYNNITTTKARTSMAIKTGTEYVRMLELETDLNSIIWIKVSFKNKDPFLICSGYRQWTLPTELGFKNSNEIRHQRARFETYLESIQRALNLKLKLVILHD